MADINDIVCLGFGSWSSVNSLPTLGFGIGEAVGVGPFHWAAGMAEPLTFARGETDAVAFAAGVAEPLTFSRGKSER